jgi:hypothetical protein
MLGAGSVLNEKKNKKSEIKMQMAGTGSDCILL